MKYADLKLRNSIRPIPDDFIFLVSVKDGCNVVSAGQIDHCVAISKAGESYTSVQLKDALWLLWQNLEMKRLGVKRKSTSTTGDL